MEGDHVYTDLFVKPTDNRFLLRSNSNHPPNPKMCLAYGLGLRIRHICKKVTDYRTHRQNEISTTEAGI